MPASSRQEQASARAEKEAAWFTNEANREKDAVVLTEVLRLKFLQFYSTGAMDAIDTIEERLAERNKR